MLMRLSTLLVLLFMVVAQQALTQEMALEYSYATGEATRYKRTVRTQVEGALVEGRRSNEIVDRYFALTVDSVYSDGSADVRLTIDSVRTLVNRKASPRAGSDTLLPASVRMLVSKTGSIQELELLEQPNAIVDEVVADLENDLTLPGVILESGAQWEGERMLVLKHGTVEAQAIASFTSTFARVERYRGVECARIEYQGILSSAGARIGEMKGVLIVSLSLGKKMRETSDIDAAVYIQRPEGKIQWRFKQSQMLEALQ